MEKFLLNPTIPTRAKGSLFVQSLEGDLYTARLKRPDGQEQRVCDAFGEPLVTHSLSAMRDLLTPLQCERVTLIQKTAYDEMIGQPSANDLYQLPLHW